ncbi:DNA mismatch repair protein MutS [Paeniglutamicibacter antarcticus]|uniref:DNA mismatch repair protein MutS n=1 Tax=Arthrobacter terrae TaxID=2935737 RepID=A0A931CQ46_9MICC|nr:DNA mismatch repair protein MutS [Arthrobacter terrae]MBG0740076.1 DNA mismatch repair protein MutS [Arthrobacter terrae]
MTFQSILFENPAPVAPAPDVVLQAAFLTDLQLSQIIDTVTAGREAYGLKPYFYMPLTSVQSIKYRHGIMRDLRTGGLLAGIELFAETMRSMRDQLEQGAKLSYQGQREALFLETVEIYCAAVNTLLAALQRADVGSAGFAALRKFLSGYVASEYFRTLAAEAKNLRTDLAGMQYCFRIKGGRVTVAPYKSERDYSVEVEQTFRRFQQRAAKDHCAKTSVYLEMNHVEAMVLDRVAKLFPEVFAALDLFNNRNLDFVDPTIDRFDREVQFYLAYLAELKLLQEHGLQFCYPQVSQTSKEELVQDTFDLALADTLVKKNAPVVCNDFSLTGTERIFVVSGPNQGGKTTFARTFGQLHYLASLGYPVPGGQAKLFLPDRILTHFEREEDLKDLRGKLTDDLVRVHDVLNQATSNSIVILNEIFTSTTLSDAVFLCREVLTQIVDRDLLCVCVTFIDELAALSGSTVSMVSTVVPDNPAVRTFKLERRPANGMAYALVLAEKYSLTYGRLTERIGS